MAEINAEGRQIWLRAFYGFNPEEAGYLGFTYEKTREDMIGKMKDGDLVLIYGAVDSLTQTDLQAQALGFLEVSGERCVDRERQNDASLVWKKEHGFEDRWTFGIAVRRAWRVRNRVHIRTIAPKAYQSKNRFERTTRAMLLEPDEMRYALSHPVRQVNVFGEPTIADDELETGPMWEVLKPSRGIPPSYGDRSSSHEDGENHLYLMMLSSKAETLLGNIGPHVGKALVKVGRSNNPIRRLKEINGGFPEKSVCQWELKYQQSFEDGETTHTFETELKHSFDKQFTSQGGEFYCGDYEAMERAFQSFCFSKIPKIIAASGKAQGVK